MECVEQRFYYTWNRQNGNISQSGRDQLTSTEYGNQRRDVINICMIVAPLIQLTEGDGSILSILRSNALKIKHARLLLYVGSDNTRHARRVRVQVEGVLPPTLHRSNPNRSDPHAG